MTRAAPDDISSPDDMPSFPRSTLQGVNGEADTGSSGAAPSRAGPDCPTLGGAQRLQRRALGREWLGGRDSNPDTQIQSLISPVDSKGNQQLRSAKRGKVRQNPQRGRNKIRPKGSPR